MLKIIASMIKNIRQTNKTDDELFTYEVETSNAPHFEVNVEKVEEKGGWGLSVATIDVLQKDGTYARFFVTLYEGRRNTVRCQVEAASGSVKKNVKKDVSAFFNFLKK